LDAAMMGILYGVARIRLSGIMKRLRHLACTGGPHDGKQIQVRAEEEWFAKAASPTPEWPANQPGDLRIDKYVMNGDRWVWDPEGYFNGGY
jgi:hypothetical protein